MEQYKLNNKKSLKIQGPPKTLI